jgi:hypothetical protein
LPKKRASKKAPGKSPSGVWPANPLIYEINVWVWLDELSRNAGKPLTLAQVPDAVWDDIAALGFDAVWLMGVWERSPAGIAIANRNPGLREDFRRSLPDFSEQDNVGSPYCVRRYVVDAHLGGAKALAQARSKLAERGLRLILDYVPNHVAPDHPWVLEHPEYFIQAREQDLAEAPAAFIPLHGRVFACGRDPYFPAWPDVLQLNAFSPDLRVATSATLLDIAGQCDGVRCDMSMLLLNDIFRRTWGERAGLQPALDFWREVIPVIKNQHPEFLLIAEAYWDLEWELQQQGFDYCYDKRLYDRLEHGEAAPVKGHLDAELAYQRKLLRFVENHDEPRAAATFGPEKARAAAVAALTLPGAALVHEGQLEGRRVRVPVFLARRPEECADNGLRDFYHALLRSLDTGGYRNGEWRRSDCLGWPDNASHQNLLAWTWTTSDSRLLVVLNLSSNSAQGLVFNLWPDIGDATWRLCDVVSSAEHIRDGRELLDHGLYVDLPGWGVHCFEWRKEIES